MSDGVMAVLKSDDAVEAVHDVKATIMGADSFRFKAEIDFDGQTIAKRWLEKQDVAAIYARAPKIRSPSRPSFTPWERTSARPSATKSTASKHVSSRRYLQPSTSTWSPTDDRARTAHE